MKTTPVTTSKTTVEATTRACCKTWSRLLGIPKNTGTATAILKIHQISS
jgi:hypothetical protein